MLLSSNVYTQTVGVWTLSISPWKKTTPAAFEPSPLHFIERFGGQQFYRCAISPHVRIRWNKNCVQTCDLTFTVHHVLWTAESIYFLFHFCVWCEAVCLQVEFSKTLMVWILRWIYRVFQKFVNDSFRILMLIGKLSSFMYIVSFDHC